MAGLASAGGATLIALAGVFDATTRFDLGTAVTVLTITVCWLTVCVSAVKLCACFTTPRSGAVPLTDADLPTYTVIIPLFREAHMVPGLVQAMSAIDYPENKLDIVFACEAVDPDTVRAAQAQTKGVFRTVVAPPVEAGGEPQTKPRALNIVLEKSDGDIVTIFDAEDRPHPQQLRAAAAAFAAHLDWAALQAPLDYFNTDDSPLAAQFGLEYASLFHVLLPFYDRLGLPFPLGGTSNHIRRSVLERFGGWDPYNVTEDADLAFRIAADGGRIGWISQATQEEAVSVIGPWRRQRSRWLKGYIQSWRVHMQIPFLGGWRRALMLQLTLGVSLLSVAFYLPVLIGLAVNLLLQVFGLSGDGVSPLYLGTLAFSLGSGILAGVIGALRAGKPELLRHAPFMPYYWLLLLRPLFTALVEVKFNPFHWHKTEHGVTRAPL